MGSLKLGREFVRREPQDLHLPPLEVLQPATSPTLPRWRRGRVLEVERVDLGFERELLQVEREDLRFEREVLEVEREDLWFERELLEDEREDLGSERELLEDEREDLS